MLEDALADSNPITASVPEVAKEPEINGVPEINYMPMPGDAILPPPPTPPIDFGAPAATNTTPTPASPVTPIQPAEPAVAPEPTPLGSQPSMQDQVYNPQADRPDAFKIPGM